MSAGYRAIQWTPYKARYDIVLALCIVSYLGLFIVAGKWRWSGDHAISDEILVMRALATCAFCMLSAILCIGPLARLDRRFLPILYNRRHLGVATFFICLLHAGIALGFYHGFGNVSPIISVLTSNTQYRSISGFPFEILGVFALVILFLMAATSHDFWLKNLTAAAWKLLHMLVYVAWAAVVLHVALGVLQAERNVIYRVLLFGDVVLVVGLHLIAGFRERERRKLEADADWVDVCDLSELPNHRGKVVKPGGGRERIALFRNGNRVSAVSNLCAHQGGPLGEGRIVDGCITCPWHGFTYRPEDGCAPAPFTEKVATYHVKLEGTRVKVHVRPLPPGTRVEPAIIGEAVHA